MKENLHNAQHQRKQFLDADVSETTGLRQQTMSPSTGWKSQAVPVQSQTISFPKAALGF